MNLPLPSELKLARKNAGLTQSELAGLSGVSQSVIAKIENESVDPAYSTVLKLFAALEKNRVNVKLVSDVMHSPILTVKPGDILSIASAKMKKLGVSQLPVFSNKLIGLVSEDDVLSAVENGLDLRRIVVGKVMKPAPPVISSSTPASALPSILHFSPIVCVVENEKLVGVVTRADLLTVF